MKLNIELDETYHDKLMAQARQKGLTLEAYIESLLKETMDEQAAQLKLACAHVLTKNHDLYKRLS